MLKDFKAFALRGNVVDMAVGVIIGGAFGIFIGWVLGLAISYFGSIATSVSWYSILLAFGVSAAIGIIFGYYPARRAAGLNPIEALRYE